MKWAGMMPFVFALLTVCGAGVGMAVCVATVRPWEPRVAEKVAARIVGGAAAGMAIAVGIWLRKDGAKND